MSQAGASVLQRPPATHTHTKQASISSITPSINSAPPPTKAEVERKLSVKLTGANIPRRPTKSTHVGSGNESDASNASTNLPPLITTSLGFGSHLSASPVGTPSSPHAPHNPYGPLSAIAERQTASPVSMGGTDKAQDHESALADEDESEEEGGENAQLERGMDGERIFKSGFLIKKQERRKVWKKKWFVLRSTKLAYYKDNREYSLSRAIELRKIHSVVPVTSEKQKHPFAFAIVTSDRNFIVEALSAEERDDWVRAITTVRKRMSEREEEESRRQQAQQAQQTRPVAVPTPQSAHPGDHPEFDTQPGTWTSTFSSSTGISVSPAASTSGGHFRTGGLGPGPSAWQSPSQHISIPPQSPSGLTSQMANVALGRSPSGAHPPTAASVSRRLSNPIPIPGYQAKQAQLRRNPSVEQTGGLAAGASLSPPNTTPQFVSSDEDEPYFSDPNAAWPENPQPDVSAIVHPPAPDPNQIILSTYLMKKSRKTTRTVWRKRWFYLTAAGVTYTKSHMDPRPLTFIPIKSILDVFSVDPEDEDDEEGSSGPETRSRSPPGRHASIRNRKDTVAPPKTEEHVVRIVCAKRRYDLCAPSEEEEIKWTAAIRALVNRERGATNTTSETGKAAGSGTAASKQQQQHLPTPINVPAISQQPPTPGLISTNIPSPVTSVATDSPTSVTARRTAAR